MEVVSHQALPDRAPPVVWRVRVPFATATTGVPAGEMRSTPAWSRPPPRVACHELANRHAPRTGAASSSTLGRSPPKPTSGRHRTWPGWIGDDRLALFAATRASIGTPVEREITYQLSPAATARSPTHDRAVARGGRRGTGRQADLGAGLDHGRRRGVVALQQTVQRHTGSSRDREPAVAALDDVGRRTATPRSWRRGTGWQAEHVARVQHVGRIGTVRSQQCRCGRARCHGDGEPRVALGNGVGGGVRRRTGAALRWRTGLDVRGGARGT